MQRDLPYGGDRFEFEWDFFSKKGSRCLAIDACAGDVVRANTVASADAFLLPLGTENVEFKVYPKEFIFAEKLETLLRFRTGNSRCKDFVDMWMLIKGGMDQSKLSAAIKMCFENRGTKWGSGIKSGTINTSPGYNGKQDWRMPSLGELQTAYSGVVSSLDDSSYDQSTIATSHTASPTSNGINSISDPQFKNGNSWSSYFLSGSTDLSATSAGIEMSFTSGSTYSWAKASVDMVICVRGP